MKSGMNAFIKKPKRASINHIRTLLSKSNDKLVHNYVQI